MSKIARVAGFRRVVIGKPKKERGDALPSLHCRRSRINAIVRPRSLS
ncbi:hypothetical protein PUN4_630047 [Paraburkholderia unamae]|nr:hypothetical protein PUN4_630047 [Paraburkholderia unamae]